MSENNTYESILSIVKLYKIVNEFWFYTNDLMSVTIIIWLKQNINIFSIAVLVVAQQLMEQNLKQFLNYLEKKS